MVTVALLSFIAVWLAIAIALKQQGKPFWLRNLLGFLFGTIILIVVAAASPVEQPPTINALMGLTVAMLIAMGFHGIQTRNRLDKFKAENEAEKQKLEAKIKQLEPYTVVLDAQKESEKIRQQAHDIKRDAEKSAQEIIAYSKTQAEQYKQKRYAEIDNEILELKFSKTQIQEDVIQAKKELTAIRNQIKGYGDEWIIPSASFIDELAEEYGFKEAGAKLKAIRSDIRIMVKTGVAATCDYVDLNRKLTAINFVLDAYNGKVDSILSKAKVDNYGILKQKMADAFILVNTNGQAFRNAQININYHNKRLEELQCLIQIHEIQQIEREEQRRIREQIREEERAAKEYERAMKEAQREEELINKAIAKKQAEMEAANAEQRAKLEGQIAELREKYAQAEAKNQRALSMAQQTKSGHVYIISNIGSFGENVFKIGMTRRLEPLDRVRELGDASVPFSFDVHAMIYSDDAPNLEYILHRQMQSFQVNKVNPRKEFFRLPLNEIKQYLDDMGLEVHWTLTAQATEYRESLAMERLGLTAAIVSEDLRNDDD